jgi:hypothetical protein
MCSHTFNNYLLHDSEKSWDNLMLSAKYDAALPTES